jgi:hypothetical protein
LYHRRKRLESVAIYYEPDCGFCRKIASLLREVLLPPATPVLPASDDPEALRLLRAHNSWVVRGADGKMHLKWHAIAYILSESVVLRPLAWLMERGPLQRPFERLYDLIGRSRRRLGPVTAFFFPMRTQSAPGLPALALCGLLAALALLGNVRHATKPSRQAPAALDHVIAGLQVGQRWDLFAPIPVHSRQTYEISAHPTNGSSFDVLATGPTPLLRPRKSDSLGFPNHRWLKYFNRFDSLSNNERLALGSYLCRLARAQASSSEIRDVVFTRTRTSISFDAAEPAPRKETQTFDCLPLHAGRN